MVVYTPPPAQKVPTLMDQFFLELQKKWSSSTELDICAYVLWRINWIHPFKNGNGRTARAFAYACLSLKLGFHLPGEKTLIDLIMENRPNFYAALKAADDSYNLETEEVNLEQLTIYLRGLLIKQFSSIPSN